MTKHNKMQIFENVLTAFLLIVVFATLNSCSRNHCIRHKVYPLPKSFIDTLALIKNNFNKKGIDRYIIYSSINGNCFGPSYSGRAKIYWFENEKYYCRTISKKATDKIPKDKIKGYDIDYLFREFRERRIDTVLTLPIYSGYYINPPTVDDIIIKELI